MAYETTTKQNVSPFQRIGQAIEGVAKGVDWAQQLQLTQKKMQEADQNRQMLQQKAQAEHANMVDKATTRVNELDGNALFLPDDASLDAYQQQHNSIYTAYEPIIKGSYDPKQKNADLKSKRKLIGDKGGLYDQFQQSVAQVQNVASKGGQFGSDAIDTAAANAKKIAQSIDKMIPGFSQSMGKKGLDDVDTYQQTRLKGGQELEIAKQKNTYKIESDATRANAVETKDFDASMKYISGEKASMQGAFGQSLQKLQRANAAKAWLEAMKTGKVVPTSQAQAQLALSLATMVQGGNRVAIELVKQLEYKSGKQKLADVAQWLSGNPQDALTKQFIDQYTNELQVEEQAWQQNATTELNAVYANHADKIDADPAKKKRFLRIAQKRFPEWQPPSFDSSNASAQPSMQAKPAPHGQTVKQGGKTYTWNGSDYVESK